ncbi:MAG: hypothetical protein HYS44_02070 [Candidatus Niyogibacteria bacterium]|nr:hypothetical protein [Candidatus Niyogibacteria bacterium]
MELRYLGRADPARVAEWLAEERSRRVGSPTRSAFPDFAYIYEPEECFSVHRESDTDFIRHPAEFRDYVERRAIPIVRIMRGGGIIWHGRGQIVLAPLVDLLRAKLSFKEYHCILEKTCIEILRRWNIEGLRNRYRDGAEGIWAYEKNDPFEFNPVTPKKIAFRGTHLSGGIITHGFALNVAPDLYPFSLIHPCNLPDAEATSMQKILGMEPLSLDGVMFAAGHVFTKYYRESKKKNAAKVS